MKKLITLPMMLAAFCMARQVPIDNHTFLNVEEDNIALDEFGNVFVDEHGQHQLEYTTLNLHLNIHNSENRSKKVRIVGKFTGLDPQKNYYISGCNVHKVPGIDAMANFYKSSLVGQNVLDIMLDVPQGDKNLCIVLRENDWEIGSLVVKENISIDWKGSADGAPLDYVTGNSPIDNPIKYNYINKRRTPKYAANELFQAKTLYDSETAGLSSDRERFLSFHPNPQHARLVPAKSLIDLHIGSYGAYKDTRMLMASLGSFAGKYRWNESTFDGHVGRFTEAEEREFAIGRCWAIGVFNIYSYFYENRNTNDNAMTQDEMVYFGKKRKFSEEQDKAYKVFEPNYGEGLMDLYSVGLMNDVLIASYAHLESYVAGMFGGPEIYNFIQENNGGKGKPLFISIKGTNGEPGHVMVIDGIALTNDAYQDTLVHLINLDNFGNEAYIYLEALKPMLSNYILYDMPIGPRSTDMIHRVDVDTDGDGIVDYDEANRFGTDENLYSSDLNGVSDYDKIYYSTVVLPPVSKYKFFFDVDYKYTPTQNDITLYALDYLAVNDKVSCYSSKSNANGENGFVEIIDGCRLASESSYMQNGINVGANAFVGMIYSKGGVLVRSMAKFGSAFFYNNDANNYKVTYQDNNVSDAPVVYFNPSAWPFAMDRTLESISSEIGNEQKIIRNGETFTISGEPGHNGFSFLKVESGGTLVIGTGEMYIGDIQLESGSKFKFEQPSIRSELHLNGNVIWRGQYEEYAGDGISEDIDIATARGFKLFQHSNREMYMESEWHGSIVAPYSKVVMGQSHSSKKIYGQVFGREVVVHQRSKVYHVSYNPALPSFAKKAADQINPKKDVAAKVPSNVKITGANRSSINFTTTTSGVFHISIVKLDGTVVSSFVVNKDVAGSESINWNSENIPNGAYMLSIKHNGKTHGKMISLK